MSYRVMYGTLEIVRDYLDGEPMDPEDAAHLRELARAILDDAPPCILSPDTFDDGPHFIPEDFAL